MAIFLSKTFLSLCHRKYPSIITFRILNGVFVIKSKNNTVNLNPSKLNFLLEPFSSYPYL